jgi:uncharacterized protein YwgA
MSESIFKNPAMITYLVKSIEKAYPGKQIGKTVIQKMVYISTIKGLLDANYSMHYYGPYSADVAGDLDFAESSGLLEIKWVNDKGYFVTSVPDKLEQLGEILNEKEKQEIDDIVARFGEYKANDLSIIATALYLRDKFELDNEKLVKSVNEIKDQYSASYIMHILEKSRIL